MNKRPQDTLDFNEALEEQTTKAKIKIGRDGTFKRKRIVVEQPEFEMANVGMIESIFSERKAMGWLPDLPDFRDYNINTEMDSISENRKVQGR